MRPKLKSPWVRHHTGMCKCTSCRIIVPAIHVTSQTKILLEILEVKVCTSLCETIESMIFIAARDERQIVFSLKTRRVVKILLYVIPYVRLGVGRTNGESTSISIISSAGILSTNRLVHTIVSSICKRAPFVGCVTCQSTISEKLVPKISFSFHLQVSRRNALKIYIDSVVRRYKPFYSRSISRFVRSQCLRYAR